MEVENNNEVQTKEQAQQAFDDMFLDTTRAFNDLMNTFLEV